MSNISKFVLKANQKALNIVFNDIPPQQNKTLSLSYEYLRIFSPTECHKANSPKSTSTIPNVYHKKNIRLISIEPLGKHGYRMTFDDGFNDIYSDNELLLLSRNFESNWSQYTASLSSTNNREESINFKPIT